MGKKKKQKQIDVPFVGVYNNCAVTFVQSDQMADVSIAGLQWSILLRLLQRTPVPAVDYRLHNLFRDLLKLSAGRSSA